jgi:PAS domain S-box-containing protein
LSSPELSGEALRASEERFRRCFELSPIGMAITSPSQGCLEVNHELCRILGYERSELLQMSWVQMTHPSDLAADLAQFNRVLAAEIDGYTLEKRFIRKDGRVIHTLMGTRCVRHTDGSVNYFIGLVQDITARKATEEKLVGSERRFRLLVESIPHQIWSYRADGSFGYWNQQLIDYTGLTEDELQRGGWAALPVHPEDVERCQAAWAVAIANGTTFEVQQRLRGRDGRYRRLVCRAVPVKDKNAGPIQWFGTNTDVEDFRHAEERLQTLQAELAYVARLSTMGEMAASIAHEVNQPLTAISTNASACARWLAAEPPALREAFAAVQGIVRDTHRAANVIAQIRAFLHREPPQRALINLNEVISDVLALVHGELTDHDVSWRVVPFAKVTAVTANRIQLQQVILNLLMNAIESLRETMGRPRLLTIYVTQDGEDKVRLAVRDSGLGLLADEMDWIFEAFRTTKPHGLGMGLSISRSIVEAHGGRLWATQNDGPGATFQFNLPLQR